MARATRKIKKVKTTTEQEVLDLRLTKEEAEALLWSLAKVRIENIAPNSDKRAIRNAIEAALAHGLSEMD
jgi:hypothetical protein